MSRTSPVAGLPFTCCARMLAAVVPGLLALVVPFSCSGDNLNPDAETANADADPSLTLDAGTGDEEGADASVREAVAELPKLAETQTDARVDAQQSEPDDDDAGEAMNSSADEVDAGAPPTEDAEAGDAGPPPLPEPDAEPEAAEAEAEPDPPDASEPDPTDAGAPNPPDATTPEPDIFDPDITTHSLADYARVLGPLQLGDIANNASDIAYRVDTNTFFILTNGAHQLFEYNSEFDTLKRTIALNAIPTDTEGLAYLGDNWFAVAVETNEVYTFRIGNSDTSVNVTSGDGQRYGVSAPNSTPNVGLEGVGFLPATTEASGRFFACQEGGSGTPMRVFQFDHQPEAGSTLSYDDGLDVEEPWSASDELGDVAGDLSGAHFDAEAGNLLLVSDETSRVMRVDPGTGELLEQREFSGCSQYEGVTLATQDRMVLVSEPNCIEVFQAE